MGGGGRGAKSLISPNPSNTPATVIKNKNISI